LAPSDSEANPRDCGEKFPERSPLGPHESGASEKSGNSEIHPVIRARRRGFGDLKTSDAKVLVFSKAGFKNPDASTIETSRETRRIF
jgi:hypothetical protein